MSTPRKRISQLAITSAAILSMCLSLTPPSAYVVDTTIPTTVVTSTPAGVLLVADTAPDFITYVHNRLKLFKISALKMIIFILDTR